MTTPRSYGLRDKVVLITGGARGLGRAVALRLVQEGAAVVISGRNQQNLEDTLSLLQQNGGRASAVIADVRRAKDVQDMIDAVIQEHDRIDGLVNNAGVTASALLHEMTEDQWDLVLDTNLKGAFLCARATLPHMIRQNQGAVVNLCSIASHQGQEGRANYAASKAGLMALTRVMAMEGGRHGIRVNAVAPAMAETDLVMNLPSDYLDEVRDRKPLGRLGTPDEIADVILFLLSEGAAYMTGETVTVDGGLLSGYLYSGRRFGRSLPPTQ